MPEPDIGPAARLRIEYRRLDPNATLGSDVLAAIAFGRQAPRLRDPRCVRLPLEPLAGADLVQVWTGTGRVELGQTDVIRYTQDGTHLMGWLEVDEALHGGLENAAQFAYGELLKFHAASRYPHVWRIWNFIGDINAGDGDEERYKQFCVGRARAFATCGAGSGSIGYPAATAVGSRDGRRRLTLCWLGGTQPGQPVENPRQVSAFQYPRQYGPASPSFSRAMLTPDGTLLISGTASIVGHGSVHPGDATAQLEETLRNLDAVAASASARSGGASLHPPQLTVFLRQPVDPRAIERQLRQHYPAGAGCVILDAAICRSELLLEIEAIQ
jgi:chorismate lyase/3-hydroxybenzoate synthase